MSISTHTPTQVRSTAADTDAPTVAASAAPEATFSHPGTVPSSLFSSRLALFPDRITGRVILTLVPAPEDGSDPITCSHDMASYATPGFGIGSYLIDNYTAGHIENTYPDHDGFQPDGLGDENEPLMHALRMYRPSRNVSTDEHISSWQCLEDLLAVTAPDVYGLPDNERGHYLGQLLTRWFSDGHLHWQRFRLGAMLARYYEMMPDHSTPLPANASQRWMGWETPYGVFLDVVDTEGWFHDHRRWLVQEALQFGNATWGEEFGGVRFLALEKLADAQVFLFDGTAVPVEACDEFSHTCYDDYCCAQSVVSDD